MRWLVRLSGEREDLDTLARMQAADWSLISRDGAYYLQSNKFEGAATALDVIARARDFLPVLKGAAAALAGCGPVTIEGEVQEQRPDGTVTIHKILVDGFTVRGRVSLTFTGSGGTPAPHPIERWLAAADRNRNVEKALRLFGALEHSWRNLYLVLEAIEDAVGGEKKLFAQPWSPPRLKDFKAVANSFAVIGEEARHSTEARQPPTARMALSEADALIASALSGWMNSL